MWPPHATLVRAIRSTTVRQDHTLTVQEILRTIYPMQANAHPHTMQEYPSRRGGHPRAGLTIGTLHRITYWGIMQLIQQRYPHRSGFVSEPSEYLA